MRKGVDCRGKEWEEFDMSLSFAENLEGQTFGRLTVKFRVNCNNSKDVQWLTVCECGNEIVVKSGSLKSGHTKSCGCYHRDAVSEKLAKEFSPGEQIGYWTVLYRADGYRGKGAFWHVRCVCGNETDVLGEHLRNGVSLSCGCMLGQKNSERQLINLVGKRFGLLEVIKRSDKKVDGDVHWQCKCDCGNTVDVSGHSLRRGDALSCGCLSMSGGEYNISNVLQSNNISYIYNRGYFQDLKNDEGNLLRYDFILLDDDFPFRVVEFDGRQHSEPIEFFGGVDGLKKIQRNDDIKNQYALSHNIPLVRIPYFKKNTISIEDLLGDKYLFKGEI